MNMPEQRASEKTSSQMTSYVNHELKRTGIKQACPINLTGDRDQNLNRSKALSERSVTSVALGSSLSSRVHHRYRFVVIPQADLSRDVKQMTLTFDTLTIQATPKKDRQMA